MKRDTLAAVLLALLAVGALGVAAATLDSAVSLGDGGLGGADGDASGADDPADAGTAPTPSGEAAVSPPPVCYEFLREPPALVAFVAVLLGLGWATHRDTRSRMAAVVVAGALGAPLAAVGWLLSACRPADEAVAFEFGAAAEESGLLPQGGGGGSGLGRAAGSTSAPELLFALVVIVALVASVAILFGARGDDEPDERDPAAEAEAETDPESPDLRAVGRTAGAAADRIESSDADNEVYRAWRDMTEVLDVDRPASSTPAEFAAAAVDAGVEEGPVAELTAAFERVRYGGEDATEERERRAVAALRRIEERHGGGE
ncbi:DUF4129 domain-containing protein [Halorubrum sp. AD140]|uniref:DUF4129 domain-containing protein n=1 Tax=Halorubrum sp. AD140 TaxID=3050073 RepID=UPI002ACCCA33|nr:DUF4129 domain-containing protein [Halorubrum sp. AD140]MDZ5812032.1 DUF4129 domain-containing protein [Halorubrum sp. AD140]